jgi:fucose permease
VSFIDPAGRRLYFALLANFIVFGMTVTMFGATVPKVIEQFGWGYLATGLVVSASPIGYFVSAFASGILVRRFGPKRVIVCGLLVQGAGLAFFGTAPGLALNLSVALAVGLGGGATEVVTNFCVSRMERAGRSRLMNLMHAAFTFGAMMSPILIGWVIAAGGRWQSVYQGVAVLSFAIVGGIWLCSFESVDAPQEVTGGPRFRAIMRQPLLGLFFAAMLLFTGAELGLSSWISEYSVKVLGSSASVGAWMVSVFWLGVLCGRLAFSALYRGSSQVDVVLMLGSCATVLLGISLLVRSGLAPVMFLSTGLGYSVIYPSLVASAGHRFKEAQAEAIATAVTGGGIGSFLFPLMIGGIAGGWGIAAGIWFCVAATGAGTLVAWLVSTRLKEYPRSPSGS